MLVVGVDPGAHDMGVAIIKAEPGRDPVYLASFTIKRKRRESLGEFLLGAYVRVAELAPVKLNPAILACEPAHLRTVKDEEKGTDRALPKPHEVLSKIVGVMEMLAASWKAIYTEIQPSTWRKDVTGSGRADYAFVRRALLKQLRQMPRTELAEHELAALSVAVSAWRTQETEIMRNRRCR